MKSLSLILFLTAVINLHATPGSEKLFRQGVEAYTGGEYGVAAALFHQSAKLAPAPGTFQNWGSAEWQAGQTGLAILAWERASWLEAWNPDPLANLRFARNTRSLDAPEIAWYEVYSTWLPVNAWAWLGAAGFWSAVSLVVLPGNLKWRRSSWTQGLAALSFALFLFALPAFLGVQTRAQLGILLPEFTPLRLSPTAEGQIITRLASGESARQIRRRGHYIFVRTAGATGWVEEKQFGRIAGEIR